MESYADDRQVLAKWVARIHRPTPNEMKLLRNLIQNPKSRPLVAVLIATRDRRELLSTRALPSIEAQTRPPDFVILVEDTRDFSRPSTRRLVRRKNLPRTTFLMLRNERHPGASGAWNTGIDHLQHLVDDPRRVYLAVLDDDDRYEPNHIERCLARALKHECDMVAAPLLRHEWIGDPGQKRSVPAQLRAVDFLVSSNHIQGSNLFVRLSSVLAAGMFDEGQKSVTDRDLLIRLSELPGIKYRRSGRTTVHHHAENERPRMSSPRSPTRCEGLTGFHRKWRTRMSEEQEHSSRKRAKRLFHWMEPPPAFDRRPLRQDVDRIVTGQGPVHGDEVPSLVLATAASARQLEGLTRFVARVAAEVPRLCAFVVEAGSTLDGDAFASASKALTATGVEFIGLTANRQMKIATNAGLAAGACPSAEAFVHAGLAHLLERRKGALGWWIDPDLDRGALVAARGGMIEREFPLSNYLATVHRAPGNGLLRGIVTGAPVLAPLAMLRTQLVDLYHNVHWLGRLDPNAPLPDRGLDNSLNRAGRVAWFDDESLTDTDVIERPFWIEPATEGETVREAFVRLGRIAHGLARGESISRPIDSLAIDSVPFARNLLVRDAAALLALPVLSAESRSAAGAFAHSIEWRLARIPQVDDVMNEAFPGPDALGIPLRRATNPGNGAGEFDLPRFKTDLNGAALYHALVSLLERPALREAFRAGSESAVVPQFQRLFRRHLERRISAAAAALARASGVANSILHSTQKERSPWAFWWSDEVGRSALDTIRSACRRIEPFVATNPASSLRGLLDEDSRDATHRFLLEASRSLTTGAFDLRRDPRTSALLVEALEGQRVQRLESR